MIKSKTHCYLCDRIFDEVGPFNKTPYFLKAKKYVYNSTKSVCSHCQAIQEYMIMKDVNEDYENVLVREHICKRSTKGLLKPLYNRVNAQQPDKF